MTLTDDEGTAVTLKAEPQKIVSLTPAVTETLFAVGAGDRVVATDDSSDYPAEAKALPDVVTFGTVDVEKIVALEPDLVIAGGAGFTSAESIAKLRALGIPVLVVSTPSIDGIYKDIELVGSAVGEADAATALTTKMRADMAAIATAAAAESAKTPKPPRVFYDVGYIDATGQIYGPAEGSFLAEMVGMLGVDVITGDKVTYEVPLETLISRDPEVIILGVNAFYTPTPETIAKRPGWSALTAVKNGDVRSVSDTEITRPGPAARDRDAEPRPRDVPGPRPSAGQLTDRHGRPHDPRRASTDRHRRLGSGADRRWSRCIGLVLLAVALVAGVTIGSIAIGPTDTLGVILKRTLGLDLGGRWTAATETIVWELRLPRVLTAALVGAGLAVAGATFQGIVRNPLADPYVLGTSSGAALGAALAILLPVGFTVFQFGLVNLLAFVGAMAAALLVFRLGGVGGPGGMTRLLLTGYAVGSILAALLTMAMYVSGAEPPGDLLVPARRPRRGLVGAPPHRDAAHRHRVASSSGCAPARSMDCCSAMRRRRISGSRSGASASILLVLASMTTAAAVAITGPDRVRRPGRPARRPAARRGRRRDGSCRSRRSSGPSS